MRVCVGSGSGSGSGSVASVRMLCDAGQASSIWGMWMWMEREGGRELSMTQTMQIVSHTHSLTHSLACFISFLLTLFSFWAPFSTCNRNLDISAPGVTIWGLDTQSRSQSGPYRTASGTSMAAAHVSGIVAKIWSQCPSCSNVQVTSCIKSSAADLGDYPWCYGAGLVQAEGAYQCLKSVCC
jgi:subtilisin family serine protease